MREERGRYPVIFYILLFTIIVSAVGVWYYVSQTKRSELTRVDSGWVVDLGDVSFPTVMIRTGFSETRVLLNDALLYESEPGRSNHGRLTGTRVLFLSLPKDAAGKTLIVERAAGYDTPLFGSYKDLFRLFVIEAFPALAVGSFLLIFGIIFLFLTTGFSITLGDSMQHVYGAAVSVDLGLWLLSSHGLSTYFLREPYGAAMERITLILMIPMLLFLVYYLRDDHGMMKRGIVLYVICAVIYIFILLAGVMAGIEVDRIATLLPSVGCLAFVIALMLHYYLNISASYARQKEYESLTEKAYVDALTGLPNRKRAQDVFRSLNATIGSYGIVSLDLDNLKIINDRFGHNAGDEMLMNTADILNSCFGDQGFRARMGGDEFVVVTRRMDEDALEEVLQEVNERLREAGQAAHGTDYSISYGYALKEERPTGDSADIFQLADMRMYRQKESKKGQRFIES